jgi:hypothetical protein
VSDMKPLNFTGKKLTFYRVVVVWVPSTIRES